MGHQKFDSLATKFLKLLPSGAAPTNGFYLDASGNLGFALAGVVVWQGAGASALLAGDGAIGAHAQGSYVITKGSAAALTLAAPTAGTDDGKQIVITSRTAFAHVITATGLLKTGSAAVNTATFAAFPGASLRLVADNGLWNVLAQNAITFA